MNQEKIGKFIKEIRQKENMSQQKFAKKYGVTFQAVSKWENGKNIPDLAILKKMCEDYNMNLDDFLDTKKPSKKRSNSILVIISILIVVASVTVLTFLNHKDAAFEFKTLSPACDNFNLYGSIAYNDKSSSIYITNITYCGGDDLDMYQKIECSLYEKDGNKKLKISSFNYDKNEPINLEEFLKNIEFKIDNYAQSCKKYKENSLYLEIEATKENEKTYYEIPLSLNDPCNQ